MATSKKQLTISLPAELEERLDRMKQEKYYKTSHSKMLQELICIGLDATEKRIKEVNKRK